MAAAAAAGAGNFVVINVSGGKLNMQGNLMLSCLRTKIKMEWRVNGTIKYYGHYLKAFFFIERERQTERGGGGRKGKERFKFIKFVFRLRNK